MSEHFAPADTGLGSFVERLLRFDTTGGEEAEAQTWLKDRLDAFGFRTYEWTADADRLAAANFLYSNR